jgi:NAD dependent epimerase/dehydratase family enzyme
MATVTITGGTGMIGTALKKELLSRNHEIIILTRDSSVLKPQQHVSYVDWDIEKQTIGKQAIERADFIIHLAGADLSKGRWTDKRKKEIVESRVKSGELLVNALHKIPNKVRSGCQCLRNWILRPRPSNPQPQTIY